MSALRWVPVLLLALGAALVVLAVATGGASFALVIVFPIVWGGSLLLAGGVGCLFLGIFTLPLWWADGADPFVDSTPLRSGGEPRSGGVVLVGPLPIFWGSWRNPRRRVYWLAVAFGVAVLVVVSILFVVWLG